jgi:hypothetical protein
MQDAKTLSSGPRVGCLRKYGTVSPSIPRREGSDKVSSEIFSKKNRQIVVILPVKNIKNLKFISHHSLGRGYMKISPDGKRGRGSKFGKKKTKSLL